MCAIQISVAGEAVRTWNDDLYRRLRVRDDVPDDFLADPDHLGPFKAGGGKGGDLMSFTKDGHFIVKELSRGDHESLLRVTASYVDRVFCRDTLLCTLYLHYTELSTGRMYVVMRNILMHKGPYIGLYDLKGCADDKTLEREGRKVKPVHKRIWRLHMWCGECAWSPERVAYYQGKMAARRLAVRVTDAQRERIVDFLKFDTDWLASNNLMDYSLLLGMRRLTPGESKDDAIVEWARRAPPGELRQPLLHKCANSDDIFLVYIGIIDFLQAWTLGKKVAMCIKSMERNKATIPPQPYAKRFFEHFARCIQGGEEPLETPPETAIDGFPSVAPFLSRYTSDAITYYSCRSFDEVEALLNGLDTPKLNGSSEASEGSARSARHVLGRASTATLRLPCFSGLRRSATLR